MKKHRTPIKKSMNFSRDFVIVLPSKKQTSLSLQIIISLKEKMREKAESKKDLRLKAL